MTIKTRQEVREALASLLSTALTGVGNPAQVVYDYLPPTFNGQSPVVCVASESIRAEPFRFGVWKADYGFSVIVLVSRGDEQVAEDALDATIQKLYETLEDNAGNTSDWQSLEFGEASNVIPATVGGGPYWMETMLVLVEVYE